MIKAIETKYKGCRFRSRLEARWAVFFDSLDVRWEYEKEGYELSTGWYLPDFYLPDFHFHVEIKPSNQDGWKHAPGVVEWDAEFEDYIPVFSVVLVCGEPGEYTAHDYADNGVANLGVWGECEHSVIRFGYRCNREFSGDKQGCDCDSFNHRSDRIIRAITASRSARFEYGESG